MEGGINLYINASGNPINAVDPFGLFEWKQFLYGYTYGQMDEIVSQFESFRTMVAAGAGMPDWATSLQTSLLQSGLDAYRDLLFAHTNGCDKNSTDSVGYWIGRGVI